MEERKVGWMDGCKEGRMEGWMMGGWMQERKEGWKEGWMDECKKGRMVGWRVGREERKEKERAQRKPIAVFTSLNQCLFALLSQNSSSKVIVFGNNRGKKARSLYKSHITPVPFYYIFFYKCIS